jgi:hypothetical protein
LFVCLLVCVLMLSLREALKLSTQSQSPKHCSSRIKVNAFSLFGIFFIAYYDLPSLIKDKYIVLLWINTVIDLILFELI